LNGDVPIDQLISTDALRFVIKANKNWNKLQYWSECKEERIREEHLSCIISKDNKVLIMFNENDRTFSCLSSESFT
jgi:hypothetical protein